MTEEDKDRKINIEVDGLESELERVLYSIGQRDYNHTCRSHSTASYTVYNTCGSMNHTASGGFGNVLPGSGEQIHAVRKPKKVDIKKNLKAEAKACELIADLIGNEQAAIYKKTKRIITKPGKYFWIVGNVLQDRIYHDPFDGKPDVVRVDNEKKLYYTRFCVNQLVREQTPYTDKVISFATNLVLNEKEFKKTINRISEGKFNSIKECALWEFK